MEQILTSPDKTLKGWRAVNGITQASLAEQIDKDRLDQRLVSLIEAGVIGPTARQARKLEELTGIPASAWFEEAEG